MKLKGTMVLELTDGATGEVETVTEENMVTEAVNDILGMNPMGVFYSEERLADVLSWNDVLLPVCPNMVGGILLFSKALEEDAGHIYELSDNLPVAYASNNVNTTANAARGSLNQTESKVLEDGYKFVWEFTPSQGNGMPALFCRLRSWISGIWGRRSRLCCLRRWRWILRGICCIRFVLRIPV